MSLQWFATWRTYGTWLPGEEGFVGEYKKMGGTRQTDNRYGEPGGPAMPALADYSRGIMRSKECKLDHAQATVVLNQLLETCSYRKWHPKVVAILSNHVHIILATGDEANDSIVLRDFKSYCSRALNKVLGGSFKGDWWAAKGNVQPILTQQELEDAVQYVLDQENPLILWQCERPLD